MYTRRYAGEGPITRFDGHNKNNMEGEGEGAGYTRHNGDTTVHY